VELGTLDKQRHTSARQAPQTQRGRARQPQASRRASSTSAGTSSGIRSQQNASRHARTPETPDNKKSTYPREGRGRRRRAGCPAYRS
jgi:hypothetical protein